jgi:hypothetical protein
MFVLADSQLHELGGRRFPGQLGIATALVPVARRPIELDMLSAATVVRFQSVYESLAARRAQAGRAPTLWAHLGDFADLSCTREIERMLDLLRRYGGRTPHLLAGVAPGNHDSSFTGNFGWSPYWTSACADESVPPDAAPALAHERLDKAGSDLRIAQLVDEARLAPGAASRTVEGGLLDGLLHASPAVWFAPTARYTVTPLGVLAARDGSRRRGVVAVFLDTADRLARDFGIAGSFGTFSKDQAEAIRDALTKLRRDQGADYADPWYVLLGHHPYMELTSKSRAALDGLVASLDVGAGGCVPGDDVCGGPRVLGLVTAHTHIAEAHRHCINRRLLREIVVGSVIDPPQQAARLEIGLDARGRAALRLATLPAVDREGMTCEEGIGLSAAVCHRAVAAIAVAPECHDLVHGADETDVAGQSCEDLERPLSLDAELAGLARHGGPRDPDQIKVVETRRARALLRCLCRDASPDPRDPVHAACADREPPLDGERYARVVEALARDRARTDEVTCLSWAAAAVQEHKANGMTMGDALRCAFDDPTLPAARVVVATAEDTECQ